MSDKQKHPQTTRNAAIPFGGQNHTGGIDGQLADAQKEIERLRIQVLRLEGVIIEKDRRITQAREALL